MPATRHDAEAALQDWRAAVIAIELALAAPQALGGVVLRGPHGPVRDALLMRIAGQCRSECQIERRVERRVERLAAGSADEALEPGLDVAGTLQAGRTVRRQTVLERLDAGAVLLLVGAERLSVLAASRLASWLDDDSRTAAIIALDESEDGAEDESRFIDGALGERLALHVRLPDLTLAELQRCSGDVLLGGALLPAPDEDRDDGRHGAANGPSNRVVNDGAFDPSRTGTIGPAAHVPEERIAELVHLAQALGIRSARAAIAAVATARALADRHERETATLEDCAMAARLVLAPRAARSLDGNDDSDAAAPVDEHGHDSVPPTDPPDETATDTTDEQEKERPDDVLAADADEQAPDDRTHPPGAEHPAMPAPPGTPSPSDSDAAARGDDRQAQALPERLVAAVTAALPPNLLGSLASDLGRTGRSPGRRGSGITRASRGRPAGVTRPRSTDHGRRLDIVATLKAAVPWQRLRNGMDAGVDAKAGNEDGAPGAPRARARLAVRPADFRIRRHVQPLRTTTVFIVDASGSAAMHRIGEAKGALEAVLAECYVRRDRVALISFRGAIATLELPPTRSLARARRALVGLAAGGGTPIATGLDLASEVLQDIVRGGERAVGIIMSDGRANVARNGQGGRPAAQADAEHAAERLAGVGARLLFVDTAPRPRPIAAQLAARMQARYLPLPLRGGAQALPELLAAGAPDSGRGSAGSSRRGRPA